ncbi:MAG: D-lysine 5,6-aminomutase subunit alpha, partial [Proteobacteria bacterium]|nr:D-lysine 5,6-aminomutase subunit alpha [Pseudomonadota bacterium]
MPNISPQEMMATMYSKELPLNERKIARCRKIAAEIGNEVASLIHKNSTVGTERGILRMLGLNGALKHQGLQYPVANLIVDQLKENNRLQEGVLFWVANALLAENIKMGDLEKGIAGRTINIGKVKPQDPKKTRKFAQELSEKAYKNLKTYREKRKKLMSQQRDPLREKRPLKYVIVATGNIFEDVTQAKSAVRDGADIIAVIRSTAQSLLDYVPHGTTTEGFGGTYATQGNFRVMREALDALGPEVKRYIRLTNYCSGLCMSEIAALASLEGLDCLLNDAMYGILFRDINPRRTLIDQHFSRLICSVS